MKQNKFKCKYLECNMDGCYCRLGLNFEVYGHCLIPNKQDNCYYYQEKESEDKKQIREMASDMDFACTKHDLWPEDAKEIARVLRTLGYRKCPDDCIREVRKETAADWYKMIISRLKELWIKNVLTTNIYNALVDYFNKVLKLYDDNKEENNSRCHKCVYEMHCSKDKDNNRQCPNYKKDSPDGGYYG